MHADPRAVRLALAVAALLIPAALLTGLLIARTAAEISAAESAAIYERTANEAMAHVHLPPLYPDAAAQPPAAPSTLLGVGMIGTAAVVAATGLMVLGLIVAALPPRPHTASPAAPRATSRATAAPSPAESFAPPLSQ